MTPVPQFADLPFIEGTTERHSWDVFGPGDEFGCLNFITPEKLAKACAGVELGQTVNLDLPLTEPSELFWSKRDRVQHHEILKRNSRDGYLDSFYLQGSTQWDGFRHQRFRQFGYYGGLQESDLDDAGSLGIERWAERGIMTRGVLIDVAGHWLREYGVPLPPDRSMLITSDLIRTIAEEQNTAVEPGDIILLRTGWVSWYLGLDDSQRAELADRFREDRTILQLPGLDASTTTAAWLWDSHVAAIAADNPTLEALPYNREVGWAHHRILVLLGLPLGELWALDDLAAVCEERGRYSFLLVSSPLNLPRGCASPANAYAVF